MRNHLCSPRRTLASIVCASLALAACGGDDAPTTSDYATRLNDVCRTLDAALTGLPSASATEIASSATTAKAALSTAVTAAAGLNPPSTLAGPAKQFMANLGDEAKLLGEIAAAATGGDQATLGTKVTALNKLIAETTSVADTLGATRCAMDPLFGSSATTGSTPGGTETPDATLPDITVPVVTLPDITVPATVTPAVTVPSVTVPNVTIPVVTSPDITIPVVTTPGQVAGLKSPVDVTSRLTVRGAYGLAPADQEFFTLMEGFLAITPAMNASSGSYGVVNVIDTNLNQPFGRAFVYIFDSPVPAGTVAEWTAQAAGGAALRDVTIDGNAGQQFTGSDGEEIFVSSDDTTGLVFIVANNGLLLGSAVSNFFKSV